MGAPFIAFPAGRNVTPFISACRSQAPESTNGFAAVPPPPPTAPSVVVAVRVETAVVVVAAREEAMTSSVVVGSGTVTAVFVVVVERAVVVVGTARISIASTVLLLQFVVQETPCESLPEKGGVSLSIAEPVAVEAMPLHP